MREFLSSSDQKTVWKSSRQQQLHDQKKQENKDCSRGSCTNGGISRFCSDCNTTKTPLWRSGPGGPKSLCNACGIRKRKERKAMAAATGSGRLLPADKSRKDKALAAYRSVPFKKRCRFIGTAETAQRKLSFEEIVLNLNNSLLALNRAFPQDEKDAAILLMALSWGIVCSL